MSCEIFPCELYNFLTKSTKSKSPCAVAIASKSLSRNPLCPQGEDVRGNGRVEVKTPLFKIPGCSDSILKSLSPNLLCAQGSGRETSTPLTSKHNPCSNPTVMVGLRLNPPFSKFQVVSMVVLRLDPPLLEIPGCYLIYRKSIPTPSLIANKPFQTYPLSYSIQYHQINSIINQFKSINSTINQFKQINSTINQFKSINQ